MKKFRLFLLLVVSALFAFALAACGEKEPTPPAAQTITGVTFEDKTVEYDGQEHEITVTGTLPAGVSVAYTGNKGTAIGTYSATATLTGEGYTTLTLHATLTIEGKTITGVTFTDKTVEYTGEEHEITVTGTLPAGVSVAYTDNKGTDTGTYNATAVLSGEGYTTLTLHATLTIEGKDITGVTFSGDTVTYNGQQHEITVTGALPDGVSVAYTNNKGTDAGAYNATAVLSGTGYNTLTLTATLTIEKATITGVTFTDKTVTYSYGTEHKIEIAVDGALPAGVTATYTNNKGINAGTYNATATVGDGDKNYNTWTETAMLTINKATIEGVTFEGETATYDGQPHTFTVTGLDSLPEDVTYTYSSDTRTLTDADTITVTLTIGDGDKNYNTWTKAATLTVNKATIEGVTLVGKTVTYKEGTHYSLELTGNVPAGVNVAWTNNDQTEPGSYEVTATLTGKNYETLELKATLRILPDFAGLAQTVMNAFGSAPDVWEFLPENFRLTETHAYTGTKTIDFTTAQNVSVIPQTGIGKQLDVVYGTVVKMQDLLGYVETVYKGLSTIANLYQTYLNGDPDNYREFSGTTDEGGMQFRILLEDEQYTLLVKVGPAAVELCADTTELTHTGRVQITDTNALKFEVGEDSLKIALEIIGTAMTQLEFVREEGTVVGYLYECLDTEVADHALTFSTSALLTWSGKYVTVSGTNGDFIPGFEGSLVEVYDADTGRFLGSEVKEKLSGIEYNTYWFPLSDFSGINTVQYADKKISVNGAEFKTKTMGLSFGTKVASRRYDIEMKKIYLYTYDSATQKFDKISMEIPMFFVQAEVYDELEDNFKDANNGLTAFANNVSAAVVTEIASAYETQLPAYEEIKDLLTPDDIKTYVGSKNSWFAQ